MAEADELIALLFREVREAELVKKYDIQDKTFLQQLKDKASELAALELDPEKQAVYKNIETTLDKAINIKPIEPVEPPIDPVDPIDPPGPISPPVLEPEPPIDPVTEPA